jgi:hypothetical protein
MSNLFEKLENRQVRFFISSTFLDLDEERNYLVKKVFPGIKKYCSDRDIEFTEVDLRWGITEDESRSGKIIQTCLREIDRAYPCFIGILKNRYGWVPEFDELDKNPQLTDQYSWVTDQVLKKRSITEIEFFYGALGYATLNKDKPNAFFYIDNSAERYSKTISGIKIDYPEDVHLLRQKLIAQKDFPVCRFNSIRSLEEKLTKDLESYIETCFHKPVEKNLSEKLLDEHIRFAQSRQRVYIPNEQFYTILDEHFVDDSSPLIITGESGSGKTSLISNWLKRINKVHPELFMFFHFTGGATDSTDPMNFLYRLLHELKTKFNIPVEIPTDSSKYQETLNIFLNHQDIKAIRWLLVIDGINQMDDYSGKNSLDWFPMSFPVNIRVIISCLEGEILSRMESRGYTIRKINLLNNEDKEVLTLQYLKQYSKALDTPVLQKITSDPKTGNPLILRTLIDELRIFGSHINLTNHLDDYLNSETNEIFFQTFLQRLENDFLHENKELVKEILGLIAISRKGLSESEILAITKIKPLHWAQFYHSVESHLINRGGFLVFSHNFLKQAVGKKYFENSNYKQWLVGKITRYFEKNRSEKRSSIELPYQYENSEQWRKLKKFLGNAERFILLYDMDEVRLLSFWKKLREKYSMGDVYLSSFTEYVKTNPGKEKELILAKKLGKFLSSASCNHEALKLLNSALKLSSEINNRGSLETVEILNEIGEIYYQISENKKALVYYNRALSLVKKIGKENELIAAKCYENIAWIYDIEMKYSQALKFGELALTHFAVKPS